MPANKKLIAIFLSLIMVLPILGFLEHFLGPPVEGPRGGVKLEREINSLPEALNLTPPGARIFLFTSVNGIEGTEMGDSIETFHQPLSNMYGAPLLTRYRSLSATGWFELHDIGNITLSPSARMYSHRGYPIHEMYMGSQETWPWVGLVGDVRPIIFGPLSQQVAPPYIIGLDEILDLFEEESNLTAYPSFEDFLLRAENVEESKLAIGGYISIDNLSDSYYLGISHAGEEVYLLNAVLHLLEKNESLLAEKEVNATPTLLWYEQKIDGEYLIIKANGTWNSIWEEARRWKFIS
jgi:hypothetical protein